MIKEICDICTSPEKGKFTKCQKCEKFACKFCIPSVLVEKICVMCVRNSIREEIITENLEKCKNLEETLSELKKIAKYTQLGIEALDDTHFKLENSLKTSEISHLERLNNLQLTINKTKESLIPYTYIENLEKSIEDLKKNQKISQLNYKDLTDEIITEKLEQNSLLELEKILTAQINDLMTQSSTTVPYSSLRLSVCENCSKKIKTKFGDQIKADNRENKTIL